MESTKLNPMREKPMMLAGLLYFCQFTFPFRSGSRTPRHLDAFSSLLHPISLAARSPAYEVIQGPTISLVRTLRPPSINQFLLKRALLIKIQHTGSPPWSVLRNRVTGNLGEGLDMAHLVLQRYVHGSLRETIFLIERDVKSAIREYCRRCHPVVIVLTPVDDNILRKFVIKKFAVINLVPLVEVFREVRFCSGDRLKVLEEGKVQHS